MHDHHGHEIKCWQKIIFPIWIWKSFIHAKHEAFEFKYEPEAMRTLEEEQMKIIGIVLYFTTVIYYSIVFVCPFVFVSHECGVGLSHWALYIYFIYAFISSVWEVFSVLRIQRKVRDAGILSFNRWHATELVMGQIARFDTYLDMCFLSIVY